MLDRCWTGLFMYSKSLDLLEDFELTCNKLTTVDCFVLLTMDNDSRDHYQILYKLCLNLPQLIEHALAVRIESSLMWYSIDGHTCYLKCIYIE